MYSQDIPVAYAGSHSQGHPLMAFVAVDTPKGPLVTETGVGCPCTGHTAGVINDATFATQPLACPALSVTKLGRTRARHKITHKSLISASSTCARWVTTACWESAAT